MVDWVTFLALVLFFALAIIGRCLRERAFRLLAAEQKAAVFDKMANYSSAEMIPFAGLVLGFLATTIFRPGCIWSGSAMVGLDYRMWWDSCQ